MIVDLQPTQLLHANLTRSLIASRLRAAQGVGGQGLQPKKRNNGRPLGGRLPFVILAAPVTATQAGWSVSFAHPTESFHVGGQPAAKPARPIVGLTAAERQTQVAGLRRVAVKQITARLQRGS